VPPELREQIFNPFFTSKKDGVGLGLSIVAKIVDDHRGTIRLDSDTTKGARFPRVFPAGRTELTGIERETIMITRASRKRSVVKAITYCGIIVVLDFMVICLLTGKVATAAGFMIISNIYTAVAYFLHERVLVRYQVGLEPQGGN